MSKAEKLTILGCLASGGLFSAYYMMKPYAPTFSQSGGETLAEKRKRVLSHPSMRVLYSSMSFFYLQSYVNDAKSLMLLKEVLDVAKPKFVALQLA